MAYDAIAQSLSELKRKRDQLNAAIQVLEELEGGGETAARKKPGRPAVKTSAASKRAPRGLMKEKIHSVLRAARKPLRPIELRDAVAKSGYPVRDPQALYAQVFAAATADSGVKKTKAGFSLRAGARRSGAKKTKKVSKKRVGKNLSKRKAKKKAST